jgi:hypothetical protein
MIHPDIILYLKENAAQYLPDKLREKLLSAGYPRDQVDEAIDGVFAVQKTQEWKPKTMFGTAGHFIGGVVAIGVLFWLEFALLMGYLSPLRSVGFYGLDVLVGGYIFFTIVNFVLGFIFLRKKSRPAFRGAIFALFGPLVLMGIMILLFFVF